MKSAWLVLLMGVSSLSMAGEMQQQASEQSAAAEQSASAAHVEHYSYGAPMDVAKVISVTDVSAVCGVTPVKMNYLDSAGQSHAVEYLVVGGGCAQG